MLVLFRFLAKHNFQYEIVYDDLGRPWTDKPVEFMLERAGKAMDYLIKQGVKHVIVPPVVEVSLTNDKTY